VTDLLPQAAPNYWKSINPGAWDAAKVNGRLYAAINQQTWTYNFGPRCPKPYTDKYNLDWTTINKLEDMEPFWDAVIKGEPPDVKAIGCSDTGSGVVWGGYYESEAPGFGLYKDSDPAGKVTYEWDNEGWVATMQQAAKWNKAGYYGKEPWPNADFAAKERGMKYATHFHNNKPGIEAEMKSITGFEWTAKILAKNYLQTGSLIATMIGINKQSAAPDKCAGYLEMVNTDKPFYNLLCYGIEGKHWVWVDKEKEVIGLPEGVTAENSGYNPNADWEYGNQFNAYYSDPTKVGAWVATKKLNDEATPSPILGFAFDPEPVKTEAAQISAVTKEYTLMSIGFIDYDEKAAEYQQRVKDAGAEKVLAEINKQLEEWRAAKA
jgi:putative aldouronate transport system substrate-binding protein